MEDYRNNSFDTSDAGEDLRALLSLFLRRWKWFVLSVTICVGAAYAMLLHTPPTYERGATVLIKESANRRASNSDLESMMSLNGAAVSSKVANEIVAFKSSQLMADVVADLGLETECQLAGRFHNNVVYGITNPVNVKMPDFPGNMVASFRISVPSGTGTFSISDIRYRESGMKKDEKCQSFSEVDFGDTLSTVFGRLIVERNPLYTGVWKNPVQVYRTTSYSALRRFSSRLGVNTVDSKNRSDLRNRADIIELRIADNSTTRAEAILQMLITNYNNNWVADNNKMAASTSLFIQDRLEAIEEELGSIDEDISEFKSRNLITDVKAASQVMLNQDTDIQKQTQEVENELYVARYVRNILSSGANISEMIPMASGFSNGSLSNQISSFNSLVLDRNAIVAASSVRNPIAIDLQDRLESMLRTISYSVDNEVNTLEAKLSTLKGIGAKNSSRIASSPEQSKYLLNVERQQKVKENLYLYLLEKREQNELSKAFTAYNTRIIDPPHGSNSPVAPRKRRTLMIAFLIGLCIPAGVFYVLSIMDNKLRSRNDLQPYNVPLLGEIPLYRSSKDKKQLKNEILVKEGERDVINEAFRVLRTNVEFICKGREGANVLCTASFNPGSGKTFTSMNLGAVLSIRGKKVLMMDCDLRKATLSAFAGSPRRGISNYLAGKEDDVRKLVVTHPEFPNLYFLPVGTIPPNPSELISSDLFSKTIELLRSEYDYIIIDCPPIDMVADTQIISEHADRFLFVVRAGLLDKAMLPEMQRIYESGRFRNMCVILNGTDYSGHRYGNYGYGYGYGYGNKDRNGYSES